jgi:hypothetical protein
MYGLYVMFNHSLCFNLHEEISKIEFPEALLDNNTHDAIWVLLKTLVLKSMCRLI